MIFGMPGEDERDVRDSLDHAARLAEAAEDYPRPGRGRTILPLADPPGAR